MKPIDSITGLPRSTDVSRIMAAQGRHSEIQSQGQAVTFAREMRERQNSVNETPKAENSGLDSEGGSGEGAAYGDASGEKNSRDNEKDQAAAVHPAKGKILDIRGS